MLITNSPKNSGHDGTVVMGERPHTCRRRQTLQKLEDRQGDGQLEAAMAVIEGECSSVPTVLFCHNPMEGALGVI